MIFEFKKQSDCLLFDQEWEACLHPENKDKNCPWSEDEEVPLDCPLRKESFTVEYIGESK